MSRTHLNRTFPGGSALFAGLFAAVLATAGCSPKPQPVPEAPVPATVSQFNVDKTALDEAGPVTLSWKLENATSLSIATLTGEAVEVTFALEGSVTVEVEHDTFFVLTARGEGGSDSAVAGVTVGTDRQPGVLFTVTPAQIAYGESATLVWSAPAGTVSITAGGQMVMGTGARQGSLRVSPAFTTEYEVTAGDHTASVTLNVAPRVQAFTTDVTSAMPGDEVTLSWSAGGATRVSITADGRGEIFETTQPGAMVDGSFTDTVPELLPSQNGLVRYVITAESTSATVSKEITLWVGVNPAVAEFNVPPFGREGGTFPVSWNVVGADRLEVLVDGLKVFVSSNAAQAEAHSIELQTPPASAMVTLRATNARGGQAVDQKPTAPVGEPSVAFISASPNPLPVGGSPVTVTWNAPNARNLVISDKQTGRVVRRIEGLAAEQGQVDVYPNRQTDYVISVDNTIGDIAGSEVAVSVNQPARLVFSPAEVPPGGTLTIAGTTVPGVTSVRGAPHGMAQVNLPGTEFVNIVGNGGESIAYSGPDTTSKLVTLPDTFTMPMFGGIMGGNEVAISINGWFAFRSASLTGPDASTPLPSTALGEWAIAPFMEDLRDVSGEIYYRFDYVDGVRRFIVQWDNVQIDLNNSVVSGSSLTFQAQLYADGRVVFAYQTLDGVTTQVPSIGVQDGTMTLAAVANITPAAGDTISFFGDVPLPVDFRAQPGTLAVTGVAPTFEIEFTEELPVIEPGKFFISEVNPFPHASAPEGEWFEITNTDFRSYDLSGWELDFGGGLVHTIPDTANLVLPPGGTLLFASSADTAQNGGITPDYVYPSTLVMPDTAGSISLSLAGASYAQATWSASTGQSQGVAVKLDPVLPNHMFIAGVTQSTCASSGSYGQQIGSPGVRTAQCFPYRLETLAQGDFEPIHAIGTKINSSSQTQDFLVTMTTTNGSLPVPLRWGHSLYNTAYVSDNGYIVLRNLPGQAAFTCTGNCYSANKTAVTAVDPNAVIAPFWDLLSIHPSITHSGLYTLRRDPDGIPGTGDEYTIFSWEGLRYSTTTTYDLNFQVKFFDSGDIEYHYGSMAGPNTTITRGTSATIWLNSEDGRSALVHNITTSFGPGVDSNSALRFRYVP